MASYDEHESTAHGRSRRGRVRAFLAGVANTVAVLLGIYLVIPGGG